MYEYDHQLRVRYAETDKMGYVYYGNYATYFEVARAESLRALGFSYRELEESGVMMPVLDLKCFYRKPARYDELLTIRVRIPKLPGVKIHFLYDILNEKAEIIHTGETTLVFVNMSSGRPCPMPEAMQSVLSGFFEDAKKD